MQKVTCVDDSHSNVLEKGVTYYAFPHTASAYYVSKFPHEGSSFGAFQRDRFELVVEQQEQQPMKQRSLEDGHIVQARYLGNHPHFKRDVIFIRKTYGPYASPNMVYVYADAEGKVALGGQRITDFEITVQPERKLEVKAEVKVKILPPDPPQQYEQLALF